MRPRIIRRFLLACSNINAFLSVSDASISAVQWHSVDASASEGAAVTEGIGPADLDELSFLRKKLVAWRIQIMSDEDCTNSMTPELKALLHQYDALLRRRGINDPAAMALSPSGSPGAALRRTGMLASMASVTALLAECRSRLTVLAQSHGAGGSVFHPMDRSSASTLQGSSTAGTPTQHRLAAAHAPQVLLLSHVLGCTSLAEQAAGVLRGSPALLLSSSGASLMQCIPSSYLQGILQSLVQPLATPPCAGIHATGTSMLERDICDDVSSIGSTPCGSTVAEGAPCAPQPTFRGAWQQVPSPAGSSGSMDPDDEALFQAVSSSMQTSQSAQLHGQHVPPPHHAAWQCSPHEASSSSAGDSRSTEVDSAASPRMGTAAASKHTEDSPPPSAHAENAGHQGPMEAPAQRGGRTRGALSSPPVSASRLPRRPSPQNTPQNTHAHTHAVPPPTPPPHSARGEAQDSSPACNAAASPPEGCSKVQWARQQAADRAKRLAQKQAAEARAKAKQERAEAARLHAFKQEMEEERLAKLRAFKERTDAQRRKQPPVPAASATRGAGKQHGQVPAKGSAKRRHKAVPAAEAAAAAAQRVAQRRAAQAQAAAEAEVERAAAAAATNQANARQLAAARLKESRDRMVELVAREEAEKVAARSSLFARRDARLAKWKQQRRQRAHLRRDSTSAEHSHAAARHSAAGEDSDASASTVDSVDIARVAQRAAAQALAATRDVSPGKQQQAARRAAGDAVRHAKQEVQWAAYAATDSFNVSVASVRDVYATDTDASDEEYGAAAPAPVQRHATKVSQTALAPPAPPQHDPAPQAAWARPGTSGRAKQRHSTPQGSALHRLRSKHSPHKQAPPLQGATRNTPPLDNPANGPQRDAVKQALPSGDELQHLLALQLGGASVHPIARSVPEQLRTSILAATIAEGSSMEESRASTAHSHSSSSAQHSTQSTAHASSSGVGTAQTRHTPQRHSASPTSRGTPFTPFTPFTPMEGGMDTFMEAELQAGMHQTIGGAPSAQKGSPPSRGSLQYSPPSPETSTPPGQIRSSSKASHYRSPSPSRLNDSSASGVDALNLSIRSLQKLPRPPSAPRLPESRACTPQRARGGVDEATALPAPQRELLFEAHTPAADDSVDFLNTSLPATSSLQPPATSTTHAHAAKPSERPPRRTLGALSANMVHKAAGPKSTATSGGAGVLADDSFTALLQSMQ